MRLPLLKVRPEDFRVTETLGLETAPPDASTHTYLLLWKRGLTTHEALGALSEAFGVDAQDVAAAGLKDEDGITEQFVSVGAMLSPQDIERANARGRAGGRDHQWHVTPHGSGTTALRTGELDGNCFRLVVRGLDETSATALAEGPRRHTHFFVNYYDTQRFGVPGGPKETHLIGGALLAGDEDTALDLLRRSGSAEGAQALEHEGPADEFWKRLDPRIPVFYRCAHASYEWNARVRALLRESAGAEVAQVEREGLPYAFATTRGAALGLAARCPELDYVRYRWTDGACVRSTAARPTVLQTHLSVHRVEPDPLHPGGFACTLSFFLPSGGYATAAVHQWFVQLLGALGDGAPGPEVAAAVPAGGGRG
ncbi:tRNA pseudouridine(13) synthase TruD [Streptomyces sp. P9-2B-2]|uniref:tRNA pseudouridine(13) synthase TruD n=1 Tax=Streptomyces sp. P9-2B-2 TaxID=3057114 RepID=UPI0025B53158|nr:tRNA pseudouridine(13) synthase TruD [Streptomyces sp. P9-2B-2]WJY36239.1 tRNA pseudouridine(13) synthase TruD [Streptomyces sp. P9-2B-2]